MYTTKHDGNSSNDEEWREDNGNLSFHLTPTPSKLVDNNGHSQDFAFGDENHDNNVLDTNVHCSVKSDQKKSEKLTRTVIEKWKKTRKSELSKSDSSDSEMNPDCTDPSESTIRFSHEQTFFSCPADSRPKTFEFPKTKSSIEKSITRDRSNSSDNSLVDRLQMDDDSVMTEESAKVRNFRKLKLKHSQSHTGTPEVVRRRPTKQKNDTSKFALCEVYGMSSQQKKVKK